jgi:Zinc carboxypeptidase
MPHRGRLVALALAVLVALGVTASASAASQLSLDHYSATVAQDVYLGLLDRGYDITAAEDLRSGEVALQLVLTPGQVRELGTQGVRAKLIRNAYGRTARQEAAFQRSAGFNVWRDYDSADGMRAETYRMANENRDIAEVVRIGRTVQGREIVALRLTKGARGVKDGKRDAVLYSSAQHAREWISPEINRRLASWYIERYRAGDKSIKRLLKSTELWFVLVANPDGYQYTFSSPAVRLWRKTLRDNNGNGTIEVGDGVDPNRNFEKHWNYDSEGSSGIPSSDTYRGPGPASEPETQAMQGLLDRIGFVFQVNYHSAGRWLLYPEGWQIGTPTQDDPIYFALSGNLDNPAIGSPATGDAFHPGVSSDVLYVTNGETTDYAHVEAGTLAWTPELSEGCDGCGFVFPDDDALVQEEFVRNLDFALSVAKSANDPDDPKSSLGIETKPFYLRSDDTYKTGMPLVNFDFALSYGNPQEVRVLAKRALGKVTLKYRINGGRTRSGRTFEWRGGEKYGGQTDRYYRIVRGWVRGTEAGDSVQVWFEAKSDRKHDKKARNRKNGRNGGKKIVRSDSFTYSVVSDSNRRVLVLAAEDYTGASPVQAPGPHYLQAYLDALAQNGIGADVYDVDARGRRAPDALGVLSHYDAVIWYTGNDVITREPGWGPGNASRLAMDEILEIRDYLNEGGRVLYTGQNAGVQYASPQLQVYDPTAANAQCGALPPTVDPRRCLILAGSPSSDLQNDVLEYWFGAFKLNGGAGVNPAGGFFEIDGVDTPFSALSWMLDALPGAANNANSFITTSGILPPSEYPQFTSWVSARYDRPGGPFAPRTGTNYVYSQIADVTYKRLTRTISVPATGSKTLSFWTSFDTEHDWDFVFVEARTPGGNNWTTLPDVSSSGPGDPILTSQSTGPNAPNSSSCASGWNTLHPQVNHYTTYDGVNTCTPTGTTGVWHAASGNSGGWHEWTVDLSAYTGQVEISIAYASDWAVQGLGVFIDDITLPSGETTSFETDLGGWTPTQPATSAPNANNYIRTTAAGFPEAAVVATPDTLLMGFGFERIHDANVRRDVMGRAMAYLLRP